MNDDRPVRPQHYQLLCGLALGLIFLIQLHEGQVLFGLVALLIGGLGIVLRVRLSPLWILFPVVVFPIAGSRLPQYFVPVWRPEGALQAPDVVLCIATLAYVAGHYRLLSLWSRILPPDPRQRYREHSGAVVPLRRVGQVVAHYRPAALLTRGEIAWFVVQMPLFALAGHGAWIVIAAPRILAGLPPRWVQLLQMAWGLALGLFLAVQAFRYLRLQRMDSVTARMLLQDTLWHETRGEQRRIGRWLAWLRLRSRLRNEEKK